MRVKLEIAFWRRFCFVLLIVLCLVYNLRLANIKVPEFQKLRKFLAVVANLSFNCYHYKRVLQRVIQEATFTFCRINFYMDDFGIIWQIRQLTSEISKSKFPGPTHTKANFPIWCENLKFRPVYILWLWAGLNKSINIYTGHPLLTMSRG